MKSSWPNQQVDDWLAVIDMMALSTTSNLHENFSYERAYDLLQSSIYFLLVSIFFKYHNDYAGDNKLG